MQQHTASSSSQNVFIKQFATCRAIFNYNKNSPPLYSRLASLIICSEIKFRFAPFKWDMRGMVAAHGVVGFRYATR